ncbi:MAG: hypothetical protein ISP71_08385 [Flavobacteriales bacterium]|nr:hypothetical protein [Flavobacteriales bacterium]
MRLASIEKIKEVAGHPNADKLDIVKVLGYHCIVKKGEYKEGDLVVFIQPDTVLPDEKWAEFYKSKSKRVKAIKLRGEWSFGIVESIQRVGLLYFIEDCSEGMDVTRQLGVTKYEAPLPQDLQAKGKLPFNIFPTDEERYQNLDEIPYGEPVWITLKIDGQSASYYSVFKDGELHTGITSRNLDLKLDCKNNFTYINKKYGILDKLEKLSLETGKSFCLRGEIFGNGIQSSKNNPHSKLPVDFAAFNLLDVDNLKYFSFALFMDILTGDLKGIPHVPIVEVSALTPELISEYESMERLNGDMFEGVVVKLEDKRSFKIINKEYDSKK